MLDLVQEGNIGLMLAVRKFNPYKDIAGHFHISRERVRQIEGKALAKLQHPSRIKQLEGWSTDSDEFYLS